MKILIYTLKKVSKKPLLCHLMIISICTLGLSCEKSEFQEFDNELGQIHVSDTRIILTQKHIAGIKSERYQPSLTLYGFLIPMQQKFITSPQRIKIFEILVKNNQTVKKNQLLVKYLVAPRLPTTSIQTANVQTTNNSQSLQSSEKIPEYSLEKIQELPETVDITLPLKDIRPPELSPSISHHKSPSISGYKSPSISRHRSTTSRQLSQEMQRKSTPQFSIDAPFKGILQHVYYNQERVFNSFMPTIVEEGQPILILRSKDDWQFISILPKDTESQLSIGQHVNFAVLLSNYSSPIQNNSVGNRYKSITLTGQISSITKMENGRDISINIHVLPEENRQFQLKQGMKVQGKVNYGQMAVGTLVDKAGLHEIRDHHIYSNLETDLSVFTKTNASIVAPVKAFVWIVGQDRKLKPQIVEVIGYHRQTGQYLVAGIPNDVLICLVSLPKSAEGKIVKIS